MTEYIRREDLFSLIKSKSEEYNIDDVAPVGWTLLGLINELKKELTVKDEELVDKHKFCDFIRDRMTSMIDPMSKKPEEMTHKELYRSWIELWWWLDHYCEREPPKWGDEDDE